METYGYALMLSFTVLASFWLELALKVKVLARLRRALAAILPVALVFLVWVYYAVDQGHWSYDIEQTFGITGPRGVPLEEFAFFIIVPIAAIMTIEAVRRVKQHWKVADEDPWL